MINGMFERGRTSSRTRSRRTGSPVLRAQHWADRARALDWLKYEFGEDSLGEKIAEFGALGPEQFLCSPTTTLFRQVRRAFVIGSHYPALVGCCALGERILNHLVHEFADHFKGTSGGCEIDGNRRHTRRPQVASDLSGPAPRSATNPGDLSRQASSARAASSAAPAGGARAHRRTPRRIWRRCGRSCGAARRIERHAPHCQGLAADQTGEVDDTAVLLIDDPAPQGPATDPEPAGEAQRPERRPARRAVRRTARRATAIATISVIVIRGAGPSFSRRLRPRRRPTTTSSARSPRTTAGGRATSSTTGSRCGTWRRRSSPRSTATAWPAAPSWPRRATSSTSPRTRRSATRPCG